MSRDFMQLADLDVNTEVERNVSLFRPSQFSDRVQDLITGGVNQGAFKPFWDQWGDKFVLRPRELSIFFGRRGSQKSTIVNYLIADYIMNGAGKVGLASYEMDPEDMITLFHSQMSNNENPTCEFRRNVDERLEESLVLVDEMVDKPFSAIGKINAMLEDGCKLIVLDCLQRISMPNNDIDLEREFVVQVTNLVRDHKAHCILVHHSRKGSHHDGDNPMPVIDDLKGSGGLADNAHNVVAVWSNKAKKELKWKIENGYKPGPEEEDTLDMPDLMLDVKKQRKQPFEGKIGLWSTKARAYHRKDVTPKVLR